MKYEMLSDYANINSLILDGIDNSLDSYKQNYILRIFEKFIYEEDIDSEEDFYCLVYYEDFCKSLAYCCQATVMLIADPQVKQIFVNFLNNNPDTPVITQDQLKDIKNELVTYNEMGPNQEEEWKLVEEAMNKLCFLYTKLQAVATNSIHKVNYEYLATLMVGSERATSNKEFLENEINKIDNLIQTAARAYYRPLNEMPNLKTSMANIKIIPPGVLRGLAITTPMYILCLILYRVKRVANYFLQNIQEDKQV